MRNYYRGIALDMKARNMKPAQLREYLQNCCRCDYSVNKNSDYEENTDDDYYYNKEDNLNKNCFGMVEIMDCCNNLCVFLFGKKDE